MKTPPATTQPILRAAAAVACALLPLAAVADDEPDRPQTPQKPERPQKPDRPTPPDGPGGRGPALLRALDRNGDGALQQTEIDQAVAALRQLDRNEDGTVDAAELGGRPPRPGGPDAPPRRFGPEMFERLDTNGDGKISRDEAPERLAARFDTIDSSGDGHLDKAEIETMVTRMRERFQERGGPRRPRGEPGEGEGGSDRPKRPPVEGE